MGAFMVRNYGVSLQCWCVSLTVVSCLLWPDAVESGKYIEIFQRISLHPSSEQMVMMIGFNNSHIPMMGTAESYGKSMFLPDNKVSHLRRRWFLWVVSALCCSTVKVKYGMIWYRGTAVAQCLRCCATNRKVADSIPASVSGFFTDIKPFRLSL